MPEPKEPKTNLKFKHFKSGTLFISCKGSHQVSWIGNKFHPVANSKIPEELDRFCRRCEIEDCVRKGERVRV